MILFDTDKIASYLNQFKNQLPELYTWDAKIDKLVGLGVILESEVVFINSKTPYEKELVLKKRVNLKLHEFYKSDKAQFDRLCLCQNS